MEDLTPLVWTIEQLKAEPRVETTLAEESTAAAGGLGDGEQLAPTADGSVTMPGETEQIAESSEVEVGATGIAPASRLGKLVVPKEQVALPEPSEGVVGHAIRSLSPRWCL